LQQELVDLHDEARQIQFLSLYPALVSPEVVEALTDRTRAQIRVDIQQAVRTADAALVVAASGWTRRNHWLALCVAKRTSCYAKGEHAAAVELHEQAGVLFGECGLTHELARTLRDVARSSKPCS